MKSDRYLEINFESREYYSQYLRDVTSSHHKRVRAYPKIGFLSPKIKICSS